jgi:type IV pilus assembly protein PilY1
VDSTNTTATKESCEDVTQATVAGVQYRTLINIMDGKNPSVQLVGDSAPVGTSRIQVPMGTPQLVTSGKKILDYTGVRPGSSTDKPRQDNRMPEQSLRPSWRQVK